MAAMKHMAALLERAMRLTAGSADHPVVALFRTDQTLQQAAETALAMSQPLASAHGVTVEMRIAPDCQRLPAGPMGVVMLNGLRNGIQSCASQPATAHRLVTFTIDMGNVGGDTSICVTIADSGSLASSLRSPTNGSESAPSHGIGLALSQQIISELGGELGLLINPDGQGATLRATVSARRLNADA